MNCDILEQTKEKHRTLCRELSSLKATRRQLLYELNSQRPTPSRRIEISRAIVQNEEDQLKYQMQIKEAIRFIRVNTPVWESITAILLKIFIGVVGFSAFGWITLILKVKTK